ncbi:MAG: SdrD B-like domain-containing protein [Saprospiraceae bacterium]
MKQIYLPKPGLAMGVCLFLLSLLLTTCQQPLQIKPLRFFPTDENAFEANAMDYRLAIGPSEMAFHTNGKEQWQMRFVDASPDVFPAPFLAKAGNAADELWYQGLYEGVDLRVYDKGTGNAGYDFILKEGKNAALITLELASETSFEIKETGDLVMQTADGEVRHTSPHSYQVINGIKVEVDSRFVLQSCNSSKVFGEGHPIVQNVGFELGEYNTAYPVIIDPEIIYSPKSSQAVLEKAALFMTTYTLNTNLGTINIDCGSTPHSFFDSGGSGGDYGDNENYSATFCADNGGQIQFTFTTFQLEDDNYDHLFIYDGTNASASLIGDYSGASPGTVTSTNGCLHFVFDSDLSNIFGGNYDGWEASISCTAPPGPTGDYVMGTTAATETTCSGVFTDSGDLAGDYGANENTTVTFCSGTSEQIVFTFENFNLAAGDQLAIFDGTTTSDPALTGSPFSGAGQANSPGSISSSGTCLTFQFTSNADGNQGLGWSAAISCSGSGTASSGPTWTGYPSSDACGVNTEIGGTIFEDVDNNGAQNGIEPGIRDVTVTLYDDNGQVGSSVTTDASGSYSFTTGITANEMYRVEFTIPDLYEEGAAGNGSGTAVQFVEAGTCDADLGLLDIGHFCGGTNPYFVIACYTNGSPTHSSNTSQTAIARFRYNDSGNSPSSTYTNYIHMGSVGTVWGTTYSENQGKLFMGAFLKRHSGLGPGGIGAIYEHTDGNAANSATVFYDFGALAGNDVASNVTRFPGSGSAFGQVGACALCDNIDATTFGQVGKRGLGGIELSDDEQTMYVANLFDRKIYALNANSPAPGSATALPGMPWLSGGGCANGVPRPWALKYRRGKLYVGVICDGSSSSCNPTSACGDLVATVYAFDGTSWTTELSLPLNYYRKAYRTGSNYWVRWMDSWSQMSPYVSNVTDAQFAQPIFSDIEFDDDGSIIMGFADRTTMQLGYQAPPPTGPASSTAERTFAHGDILRAYYNPSTQSYTLENNGVVGPLTTTNPSSTSGPGGKSFYHGDFWYGAYNNSGIGALAIKPGTGEVMFPLADPIDPYASGVVWMSNTNGRSNRRLEVYQGSPSGNSPNFAKAGGLGDLEMYCEDPPLEIGNVVWWDTDLDGLMDPSEPGVPGVTVELYLSNTLVATTTTDNYGRYIFSYSGHSNGLANQTWQNGAVAVLPNTTYEVRIPDYATDAGLLLFGATITASPAENQGVGGTQRDNNGVVSGSHFVAAVTTTEAGENDHSIDFGFGPGCLPPAVMPMANTPATGETLTLFANATGGVPPYMYNWTGPNSFTAGDADPTIEDVLEVAEGDYYLTVTDDLGCEATFILPVVINEFDLSITPTDPACGASDGSIDITVNTGLPPYTYDWSDNGLDGMEDPTGLSEGTYSVTVTDANGSTATETIELNGAGGLNLVLAPTNPTCGNSNGAIDLTVTGAGGPLTYDWAHLPGPGEPEDLTNLAAGTYSVTVTDGSCTSSASITLTTTTPPSLSETHVDATCGMNNGSIDLTATGGTGGYTFDWDHIAGSSNSEDLTNLAPGTYDVTVTDGSGCTDNLSITIDSETGPSLVTALVNETCGLSNGSIDLTVNGGTAPYTYDWDYDGTGDNNDPEDLTFIGAGTYNVTVTDDNGCTATAGVSLTDTPLPTLTLSAVDASICTETDGAVNLTVNGSTGPYFYDWDNDGEAAPDFDTEDLSNVGPGTYTVTVTDQNGCTVTGMVTVGLTTAVALVLDITDPTTCDETGSVDMTITGGTGPFTVDWSNDGTGDDDDTEDQTGLAPGVYTVVVTEANGCTTTENISIRDIREPVLSYTLTEPSCGGANGAIDLEIAGGDGVGPYTYDWDTDGTGDVDDSQDLSSLAPGAYTVVVTDELGCTTSLTINLPASGAPALSVFITDESCSASDGAIDIDISGGTMPYTIDWDHIPGSPDMEDLTGLSAGTYTVSVTDMNGCLVTASAIVNDNPSPTLTNSTTAESCDGNDGAINLNPMGTGPFTYDWSDDAYDGMQNLSGLSEGMYSVTVTDNFGCTITDNITVPDGCLCELTGSILAVDCHDATTPTDPSDDYFTVDLTATVTNGSGVFEIFYDDGMNGEQSLGTYPSGEEVTIGGSGSIFVADGTSTYDLILREPSDPTNCFFALGTVGAIADCSNDCEFSFTNIDPTICTSGSYNLVVEVAYTNVEIDQIEILINGVSQGTFTLTNLPTGTDEFTLPDLTCSGSQATIEAYFVGFEDCNTYGTYTAAPVDPQGFIYCIKNGKIVPGGLIQVMDGGGMTDPATVIYSLDGSSGEYSWEITTADIYTMTYTPPAGFTLASGVDRQAQVGPLDPTGQSDPFALGSTATGGFVNDFSPLGNPFYLSFDLVPNDPFVILNNIPLESTGEVAIDDVSSGDCNYIMAENRSETEITVDISWTGVPAGDSIEVLITGGIVLTNNPVRVEAAGMNGSTSITFDMIADGGTYNVDARFTTNSCSDDADMTTVTLAASCCPATNYEICDDGTSTITLTAPLGLLSVMWFNEANTLVGQGASFEVDANTPGMEDDIESFYYTATDESGCPAELCCPVEILSVPCVSVGSTVFGDVDNDGAFEPGDGETGIPGVTLQLTYLGADGMLGGTGLDADVIIGTTITDDDGDYYFGGLEEGNYIVQILSSNFASGAPLEETNTSSTPTNQTEGIENNDDGDQPGGAGTVISSGIISLMVGTEPTYADGENGSGNAQDDGTATSDANGDMTVDFGIYTPQFDLALIKEVFNPMDGMVLPGDTVTFRITVFNQGTVDADTINIVDSIPVGLIFDAGLSGWTYDPVTMLADTTIAPVGSLQPSESVSIDLQLIVAGSLPSGTQLINRAEIGFAHDENGDPLIDIDSEADSTFTNDGGGVAGGATDNADNGNGTGAPGEDEASKDEDDEDPALIIVSPFDLALIKEVLDPADGMVLPGDTVTYRITVTNQGLVDADTINIVDSIPVGLIFDAGLSGWTYDPVTMLADTTIAPVGSLQPDESVSIDLQLIVAGSLPSGTQLINRAEIGFAHDENGDPLIDIDSEADSTFTNDGGGVAGGATDNADNGNGTGAPGEDEASKDEDDEDPALIIVSPFDLALIKEVLDPIDGMVLPGDTVTYRITVTNQGLVDADTINIVDSIPVGLIFDAGLSGWTYDPVTMLADTTIAPVGSLQPNESVSIDLQLIVAGSLPSGTQLINRAEIGFAHDENGDPLIDIDSEADSTFTNDGGGVAGGTTDNADSGNGTGAPGEDEVTKDEDDEDPALITVSPFDLALIKEVLDPADGMVLPATR